MDHTNQTIRAVGALVMTGYQNAANDARETAYIEQETSRVLDVMRRRAYVEGTQHDVANARAAEGCEGGVEGLPEHEKRLAYSTLIGESVEFITAQAAETFQVTAQDPRVQEIVDAVLATSPDLASGEGDEDVSVSSVLREALIAGDVPVHVRWDPLTGEEGSAWFECWEAEAVEFRYSETDRRVLEHVILREVVWRDVGVEFREEVRTTLYTMQMGECVVVEQYGNEEPQPPVTTGLPFIPWVLLRAQKPGLRTSRGKSLISDKVMRLADRYDANEDNSYKIGRYNSHSTIALIGDSALLTTQNVTVVEKDVADVLALPTGTQAVVLSLPTDPEMIEHQREVLLDSLYAAFGLTRVDQSTLQGLGGVTGYALEILNRKTDGTFAAIGKQFRADLRTALYMALDVTAYRLAEAERDLANEPISVEMLEDPAEMLRLTFERIDAMNEVDPASEFPNRIMEIRLGSGYIVDDVMVREDYNAGLFSLRETLRRRGLTDPQIDKVIDEMNEEKPPQPEVAVSTSLLQAGATLSGGEEVSSGSDGTIGRGAAGGGAL